MFQLNETYHGVFINIQYTLAAGVKMGMMTADVKKSIEFIVEIPVPMYISSLVFRDLRSPVY